jgi:hypothetical protein
MIAINRLCDAVPPKGTIVVMSTRFPGAYLNNSINQQLYQLLYAGSGRNDYADDNIRLTGKRSLVRGWSDL